METEKIAKREETQIDKQSDRQWEGNRDRQTYLEA